MSLRRAVLPEATTASNSSASEDGSSITEYSATSLKYQRQCIANVEQNLAARPAKAVFEIIHALIRGCSWRRALAAAARNAKNPHAVLDLLGYPIIAHHRSRVAQPAAFPLDGEVPQCLAGLGNQPLSFPGFGSTVAVVLAQCLERSFERATGAPKRRCLLLRDLIIERVGDGGRTAAEWDHLQSDIVFALRVVRAPAPKCRRCLSASRF